MAYDNPTKNMFVIGVTGTDGKTTTTTLIHHIIQENLGKAAIISTAEIKIGNEVAPNTYKMTSLDPFKMRKVLQIAKDSGCQYIVLEVASHALHQHRFEGIEFDMAVLTNITPEHLDYHETMDEYAATKKKLFTLVMKNKKTSKIAVLPKDDDYGRKWIDEMYFDKMLSYSINTSSMMKGENIKLSANHTDFTFNYLGKETAVSMNLPGTYNVLNALAATATGLLLGIEQEKIASSLSTFPGVVGRMEPVTHNGVQYFIDFAHTPNALKSALGYINAIKGTGRTILVFGAPGNRDRYKRPQMGLIADGNADIIIVTDDDPDTEPRLRILQEIAAGIKREMGDHYMILPERRSAIAMACHLAKPGDIVLLAGKGHELVQLTNYGRRPRSDKKVLEEILTNSR